MGTGTNVQKKLIAVHDLDIPWRPADLEQRAGRIIRQGNENKNVQIFRYVTKGTFDAYSYQTLENKQRFISQIDKHNAEQRRSRIRIVTLLTLSFIGGSIGGLIAMYLFHHKTQKDYFTVGLPLMIIMQVLVVFYLMNGRLK